MSLVILGQSPGTLVEVSFDKQIDSSLRASGELVTLKAQLSGTQSQDVIINLDVAGSATVGDDYSAFNQVLTIPAKSLEVSIDIQVNPLGQHNGNETLIISINSVSGGDGSVVIGSPNNYILTITAPVAGDTTLEYVGGSGSSQVVEYATGIDPVDSVNIPPFFIDGTPADIHPIGYAEDGKVNWIQIIGIAGQGLSQSTLSTSGSGTPGSFLGPSLAKFLDLQIQFEGVHGVSTMNAYLVDVSRGARLVKVRRSGAYLIEERYFTRVSDGSNFSVGVTTYLTRRADTQGALISIKIHNDIINPSGGLLTTNSDTAGRFNYETCKLLGLATDHRCITEYNDPSMQLGSVASPVTDPLLVKNAGNKQLMGARQRKIRHLAVGPISELQHLEDALTYKMKAYSYQGSYAQHQRRGYGPNNCWLPLLGSSYRWRENISITGHDAAIEWSKKLWDQMLPILISGASSSQTGFNRAQQGWFRPYEQPNANGQGGQLINLFWGWQNNQYEWLTNRAQMSYAMQRHCTGMYDTLGEIVTAAAIVSAHGTGNLPWALSPHKEYRRWCPHFLEPQDDFGQVGNTSRIPTNRPWHGYSGSYVQTNLTEVLPFRDYQAYGSWEGDHSVRYYQGLYSLVWLLNEGWAKDLVEEEAAHVELNYARYDADTFPSGTFSYAGYNMVRCPNWLKEQITNFMSYGKGWGGYVSADSSGSYGWYRGTGHHFLQLAMGASIIPPGSRKNELKAWADVCAIWGDYTISPTGGTRRAVSGDDAANHPSVESQWGTTDIPNFFGSIPDYWTGFQAFHILYSIWGCQALEETLKPRSDGSGPTGQTNPLRRHIVDLITHAWTAADNHPLSTGGNLEKPMNWIFVSNANNGIGLVSAKAEPAGSYATWQLPTQSTAGYAGQWDQRASNAFAAAFLYLLTEGTAISTDLLRWVKRHLGLAESATLDDAVNRAMSWSSDGLSWTTYLDRPAAGAYGVLISTLQNISS